MKRQAEQKNIEQLQEEEEEKEETIYSKEKTSSEQLSEFAKTLSRRRSSVYFMPIL